jgi:Amt family ammonium transporter
VGLFANGSYGGGWGGVHKLFKDGQWTTILNDGTADAIAKYGKMLGEGWSDVGVTGIFGKFFGAPEGDTSQFMAQFIDVCTCAIFIFTFSFIWFKVSNLFVKLRSTPDDEVAGLDMPEMGAIAYPDFHVTDTTSPPVT